MEVITEIIQNGGLLAALWFFFRLEIVLKNNNEILKKIEKKVC